MNLFSNYKISKEFCDAIRIQPMSTAGLTKSLPMDSSSSDVNAGRIAIGL